MIAEKKNGKKNLTDPSKGQRSDVDREKGICRSGVDSVSVGCRSGVGRVSVVNFGKSTDIFGSVHPGA